MKHLGGYPRLANTRLDAITIQDIVAFVATRRNAGFQVSSINRQLEVLRRIFKIAAEWGVVEKLLPKVEMLRGERHRDRVLTADEESQYLDAAATIEFEIEQSYRRALEGIRAKLRGKQPIKPEDPFRLRDVTTILIDCGLRPEECFRLKWEYVRDGTLRIPFGKTESARRTIPLSERVANALEARKASAQARFGFFQRRPERPH